MIATDQAIWHRVNERSTTEKASDHLMAGTYYVQASSYIRHGSYTIKSVFTKAVLDDDAEPNDVYTQALNLAPNSTDNGHLGFYNAGKTDYYDYWKVTIPSDVSFHRNKF